MSWWRQNWRWLLIVGGVALGLLAVVLIRILGGKRPAALLEAKLVMSSARAQAAGLESDKRVKETQLGTSAVQVQQLQDAIFTLQQATKQRLIKIDGLDAQQLAAAFKELGY